MAYHIAAGESILSLVSFARATDRQFGPMVFFRGMSRVFATNKPMTWQAWDEIFALAEEHVLIGDPDKYGQVVMHYPVLANGLLKTWRGARAARAAGLTPWQWQIQEDLRLTKLADIEAKKQQQWADERRIRLHGDPEADAKKIGYTLGGRRPSN